MESRNMTGRRPGSSTCAGGERGIVLFIALFATIALATGAVALMRTVATDVAIGSNIAARHHVTLAAPAAIESALAALFETGAIVDTALDDLPHNYFAARQPGEDARGIPQPLRAIANYPTAASIIQAGDGLMSRYVIERLCLRPGIPSADNCSLSPPSVAGASGAPSASEPPRTPYYRVTVRVDGPAGAAAFVQAMLGEEPMHHRLSWRVLDE
jgi:hypothetical protein